jgi:hypothetical protein
MNKFTIPKIKTNKTLLRSLNKSSDSVVKSDIELLIKNSYFNQSFDKFGYDLSSIELVCNDKLEENYA